MINRSSLLGWIVLLCIGCSFGVASANDVCDGGTGDCELVREESPQIWICDCGSPTPIVSPTFKPTLKPTKKPVSAPKMCGCDSCTDQVLSNMADGYTCGARIDWLISNQGLSEAESCKTVGDEFPSVCGACHADHCGAFPPTPSPVPNQGVTVKAMSYNTEYSGYSDGRLPNFAAKMREVAADIVGVQECQNPNGLASASGYAVLTDTGPQNYIFYKTDRLQALNRGYMNIPRDNFSQRTITWGQ